jgi:aminoglycoside phosphotransferase (APT) family kinase protein
MKLTAPRVDSVTTCYTADVTRRGAADWLGDLDLWLRDRLPGDDSPLEAEPIGAGAGAANLLYRLRRGDEQWVLRRPPASRVTASANDMQREWRILTALEGSPVPHPRPILLGTEEGPLDASFLIIGLVDGFTPIGELPDPYNLPESRRALSFALVDALAHMAQLDWRERGLSDLGKPEGFLERQVSRWLGQLDTYRRRDLPGMDEVAAWIDSHRPSAATPVGLMHGDYSAFNVMARHDDPTQLAAVIDWDTGTIGDPLLDLGHLLARWTEPGEEPVLGRWDIGDGDPALREGLATRAELAEHYARATGVDVSDLRFYEVLAQFKLAVILEGQRVRAVERGADAAAKEFEEMVDGLIGGALAFARGDRT